MAYAVIEYMDGRRVEHNVIRGGEAAAYEKALELKKEPNAKYIYTMVDGEMEDVLLWK